MKTVAIDKAGCTLLFLLMRENSVQRPHTISHLGHPVFDTATGNVDYIKLPQLFGEEAELCRALKGVAKDQLQKLADLHLAPLLLVEALGIRSRTPTRYVEVPAANPELDYPWQRETEEFREELSAKVIDWLEKLGQERGIHFQYQIAHLCA